MWALGESTVQGVLGGEWSVARAVLPGVTPGHCALPVPWGAGASWSQTRRQEGYELGWDSRAPAQQTQVVTPSLLCPVFLVLALSPRREKQQQFVLPVSYRVPNRVLDLQDQNSLCGVSSPGCSAPLLSEKCCAQRRAASSAT